MEFSVLYPDEFFFGNKILESLHYYDAILGPLFQFLSILWHYLGSNLFFIALLSLIYILYSPRIGTIVAVGLLSSGISNGLLKFFFKSPRPTGLDSNIFTFMEKAGEHAFGFPSGHCQSSVVVWGLLFCLIPNIFLRILCVVIILLMPFTRMYLGVHYLGDTLGGLLIGFVNLWFVLWIVKIFPKFPNIDSIQKKPRLARSYSLLVIALSLLPILLIHDSLSHPEYHSLVSTLVASASLTGTFIGIFYINTNKYLEFTWGGFFQTRKNPYLVFLVRVFVLISVIVLFYLLPQIGFKVIGLGEDILIKYLRYLVISFSIIFLTPLILSHYKDGVFLEKNLNV